MKNEQYLISRIKEGDTNAFKELFFRYNEKLCVWSYKITNNYSATEDIVQDFFIWYWINKNKVSFDPSFRSYAYRSVYNSSLNYIRDSSKYVYECEVFLQDTEPSEFLEKDMDELQAVLEKAIDELPERCKKIFVMATIEKKKYVDVAQQLGISINTVKVQVSKAYRIIRSKVGVILF